MTTSRQTEDVAKFMHISNEEAHAQLDSKKIPEECAQIENVWRFRSCLTERQPERWMGVQIASVRDASWGSFFQWSVVWRCLLGLAICMVVDRWLSAQVNASGGAKTLLGILFRSMGVLARLFIAVPLVYYLIKGLF
jgi:hypothetical protein